MWNITCPVPYIKEHLIRETKCKYKTTLFNMLLKHKCLCCFLTPFIYAGNCHVMFWKQRPHYVLPRNIRSFWWALSASKENPTHKQIILARNFKVQILITSGSYIWNIYQVFIQKLLKNHMCWDTYETSVVPSYSDAVFMNILAIACCPKG